MMQAAAAIAGGQSNTVMAVGCFVGGGAINSAWSNGATVAGGALNAAFGAGSAVVGGFRNEALGVGAFVGGGQNNSADLDHSTVGGGEDNTAQGTNSTIAGGYDNVAAGTGSTVAGGENNFATNYSAVGGGISNAAVILHAYVGGGQGNLASNQHTTIGGGFCNTNKAYAGTIGGGHLNAAANLYSTVGGGYTNKATQYAATVGGGQFNEASGVSATVPGGSGNIASGDQSFACGRNSKATNFGSFVWGAVLDVDTVSTNTNSFTVRAPGGVRFITSGTATNFSSASPILGVYLAPLTTSWAALSDSNAKTALRAVDPRAVLSKLESLPVTEWEYKHDPHRRYFGPMAQDFHAAFGLGNDDKTINTLDADGVLFLSVKGLIEELKERDKAIAELRWQNTNLEAKARDVDALKRRLQVLEERFDSLPLSR